jgi:hypothetical protein
VLFAGDAGFASDATLKLCEVWCGRRPAPGEPLSPLPRHIMWNQLSARSISATRTEPPLYPIDVACQLLRRWTSMKAQTTHYVDFGRDFYAATYPPRHPRWGSHLSRKLYSRVSSRPVAIKLYHVLGVFQRDLVKFVP